MRVTNFTRSQLLVRRLMQGRIVASRQQQSGRDLAAELAAELAQRRFEAGADLYKPEWYRKLDAPPKLFLGDDGALAAIRSGDVAQMQAALAALRARQ